MDSQASGGAEPSVAGPWSEDYIQHSREIAPGRDGLFERVRSFPPTFRYENALAVAESDYVVLHGWRARAIERVVVHLPTPMDSRFVRVAM